MGIYIPGIEMPKGHNYVTINIWSSGAASSVLFDREGVLRDFKDFKELKAAPVPEHGRLIDESEFFARLDDGIKTISSLSLPEDFVAVYTQLVKEVKEEIGKCRTIIPAEEGE